jgi:cell division protein FtsQ
LLAITVLMAAAGWLVLYSSLLSVEQVEVAGASGLAPAQVRRAAAVPMGQPLTTLDLDAVAARVAAMPRVGTVSVARSWPDTVRISVTARVPVALVDTAQGAWGVDASGAVFRLAGAQLRRLPVLAVGDEPAPAVLQEAAAVVAALPPPLARRVKEVRAATPDSITIYLRGGVKVRWGSADRSAHKASVLAVLLRKPATGYDVSVPDKPAINAE